jgi:hypothetical protein
MLSEKQLPRRSTRSKPVESVELISGEANLNEKKEDIKEYLSVNFIDSEFPELKVFKNTLFEVDASFAVLKKEHAAIEWENVAITQAQLPSTYYLTFIAGNDSCVYRVKPVSKVGTADAVRKSNDSLYREYQNTVATNKEREKREMAEVAAADSAFTKWNKTQTMILRSFSIQNFGIWNVDKIRILQNAKSLVPVLTLDNTEYHQLFYFADATRRSLTFHYSGGLITCDAKSKNLIWTITYDNKIAIIPSREISQLKGGYEKQPLKLRPIKTQVNTSADFIKLYKGDFAGELE